MKWTTGLLLAALSLTPTLAGAGEKYALLIGVTKYENSHMNRTPLKYSEADAMAVAELLQKSRYTVKVVVGKQATQQTIEDELTKLEREGTQDGVVFIGLFGHGVQYGSGDGALGFWKALEKVFPTTRVKR